MLSDHQMPDLGNLNLDCDDADLLLRVCYALQALAEYAFHRSLAVKHRAAGRPRKALRREARADALYHRLPPNWQW